MMEVTSGLVRVIKGSDEDKELTLLVNSLVNLPKEFLVSYHNALIRLGYRRTTVQDMTLTAIAVVRGDVKFKYFD